jgi:hypothetical protein
MRFILPAAAVASLALVSGPSTPTFAASSNSAEVVSEPYCVDLFPIATVCVTPHIVYQTVTTPSGNLVYTSNAIVTSTYTFVDGRSFTTSVSSYDHSLFKQGEIQERHSYFSNATTEAGVTCTTVLDYHYANGQVQIDNFGVTCS